MGMGNGASNNKMRAGGDGKQVGCKGGFQAVKLGGPGTMAGIIGSGRGQLAGVSVQNIRVGNFYKMEAADEDIRAEVVFRMLQDV